MKFGVRRAEMHQGTLAAQTKQPSALNAWPGFGLFLLDLLGLTGEMLRKLAWCLSSPGNGMQPDTMPCNLV